VLAVGDGALGFWKAIRDVFPDTKEQRCWWHKIESTFATVRLRTRVTKGPGSRAAGIAMAFELIESAQAHWRAVNAPHLVALVRGGAKFEDGKLVKRPTNQEVIGKPRDQGGHETGRHVGQREPSGSGSAA
jgi:hypothetical protein